MMRNNSACFLAWCLIFSCVQLYDAQEAPFYPTPKFAANVSHRQSLCERQRQLFNDNLALPDALRGLNLSVVLTNYKDPGSKPFFTLVDGVIPTYKPGLFAVIMDQLSQRAGFSWRGSYGVVDPIDPKADGNRTWSDLLEWEVNTYDISAGKWDKSIERMKREISFPEGWFDSSTILVQSSANEYQKASLHIWSFLSPFKLGVWALIVVTVIISGLLYYVLENLNEASDERNLENHPGAAVFYSFITMTGHFEYRPQTAAARILTFSLTLFSLIILAAYTANLVSFLVVRNTPTYEIESVADAVSLGAPICVQAQVETDEYLTKKYSKAVLVRKAKKEDIFLGVINGECKVAAAPLSSFDEYKRFSEVNVGCKLRWHGRVERFVAAGITTAVDTGILCTSLISHVLDYYLIRMKADGFLEKVWQEHLGSIGDQACGDFRWDTSVAVSGVSGGGGSQEDDIYSLSIQEMSGIFIVHAAMLATSILFALFRVWHKRKRGKQSDKADDAFQQGGKDSEATPNGEQRYSKNVED